MSQQLLLVWLQVAHMRSQQAQGEHAAAAVAVAARAVPGLACRSIAAPLDPELSCSENSYTFQRGYLPLQLLLLLPELLLVWLQVTHLRPWGASLRLPWPCWDSWQLCHASLPHGLPASTETERCTCLPTKITK